MQYDFSEDEANALLRIIDAAVRATGLEHAANGVFLAQRLRAPFAALAAAKAEAAAEAPVSAPVAEKANSKANGKAHKGGASATAN